MNLPLLRNPWWLGFGLLAVLVRGLFLDVMEVDAAQYASIAMEMEQHGSWLQVLHRGADYLDKPPLLFWVSAASMRIFGESAWACKLPSLLGALAGIYAVYRFASLFYSEQTARHAAWILATSTGLIVICNDVRTDTLLLGMTACAVWQLAAYERFRHLHNLLFGSFFVGLAMLAKGPIGLVMPAFAVGTQLLLRRDMRYLLRWQWLLGLAVIALVLSPMCWGLYHQFDLHPEKSINGRTGVSGLWFFFWEQSFGRITGGNVWKNDTSAFYFLHVYLWAFLPWCLLLIGALWRRGVDLIKQKGYLPAGEEAYSIGGFLLTFIALSFSQYKLPHYVFITLPWAAVLVARWLDQPLSNRTQRAWTIVQYLVLICVTAVALLQLAFIFPAYNVFVWGPLLIISGGLLFHIIKNPFPEAFAASLVQRSSLALIAAAFVLNFHFYPHLLTFQASSAAAHWTKAAGIPAGQLGFFNRHGHALEFYSGQILSGFDTPEQVQQRANRGALWLYTDQFGYEYLRDCGIQYAVAATFDHFQVAMLKIAFLDPATRPKTLEPIFLLKILPSQE